MDPFSSFCSFDTLSDAKNTSPICEKQPLSHIFFKQVCNGSPPWCYSQITSLCQRPVTCKKQSIIHSYLDTKSFLTGRLRTVKVTVVGNISSKNMCTEQVS